MLANVILHEIGWSILLIRTGLISQKCSLQDLLNVPDGKKNYFEGFVYSWTSLRKAGGMFS